MPIKKFGQFIHVKYLAYFIFPFDNNCMPMNSNEFHRIKIMGIKLDVFNGTPVKSDKSSW